MIHQDVSYAEIREIEHIRYAVAIWLDYWLNNCDKKKPANKYKGLFIRTVEQALDCLWTELNC